MLCVECCIVSARSIIDWVNKITMDVAIGDFFYIFQRSSLIKWMKCVGGNLK